MSACRIPGKFGIAPKGVLHKRRDNIMVTGLMDKCLLPFAGPMDYQRDMNLCGCKIASMPPEVLFVVIEFLPVVRGNNND